MRPRGRLRGRPTPGLISLCALAGALAAAPADATPEQPAPPERAEDCRYDRIAPQPEEKPNAFQHRAFPRDDVFRPLTADPLEMRFFGNFGWAEFEPGLGDSPDLDRTIYSLVGLGGKTGVWSYRETGSCDGIQLNIFGGAISMFALDPLILANIDYRGGIALTASRKPFAARLRLYHQSSHLGDDFLFEHPEFSERSLSFEAADLVGSITGGWWRLYGGPGALLRIDPADLGRLTMRAGIEIRPERLAFPGFGEGSMWTPVAATDVLSHQGRDWGATWSTKAGLALAGLEHRRRVRVLATLLYGYIPYGSFFDETQTAQAGLEAKFVY